uniref:Uncharacterized protein n=1 Tax=Arundo donax TaxID=35708 RepID=A0A0A9GXN6_ARUDO
MHSCSLYIDAPPRATSPLLTASPAIGEHCAIHDQVLCKQPHYATTGTTVVLLNTGRSPLAPIAKRVFEVRPCIGIAAPGVLLCLPILDVAAGATAAVPTTIPVRPRGDAAGPVGRITSERGGVHNDRVGERDVGGGQGDPPGYDAHAAAEAHLAGDVG